MLSYVGSDATISSINIKEGQVAAQPISIGNVYVMFVNSSHYKVLRESVSVGSFTYELFDEWPELWLVAAKLSRGERLSEWDEGWLKEISEATGWRLSDVLDELRNVSKDPAERAERYYNLYTEYLKKAKNRYELGDYRQAGEKLYGAVLALIKYFAAIQRLTASPLESR
ncbi:MAG: PaREP1 family protein [Candidatus Nezhaarchaeales archaeon]